MNAQTDSGRRGLRRAVAVAAATVTIAGVSGGVAFADPENTDKPTTSASDLLLNSSDFPSGYIVVPAPQQRLANELGADPLTLVNSAKVTPPECKNVLSAVQNSKPNDANTVAGIHDQDKKSLSESLVEQTSDIDTMKTGLLKLCSEVTVETNDPKGGVIKVKATTKETDSASQSATFETVLDGTRTKGTEAFPIKQKIVFGVASLRGYTVAVQATKLGGDPDKGEFTTFFNKAVKKIEDAK